jgi:carboxypeptidase PM20D1
MRGAVKVGIGGLGLASAVLAGVLAWNTVRPACAAVAPSATDDVAVDVAAAVERLAAAIRLRTVSTHDAARVDPRPFLALHAHLEQAFPRAHAVLRREVVGGLSLLYTWPGRDPSRKPILLSAHLDVVPVEAETSRQWSHPPFSGAVADGHVWGRGSIDDKGAVVGVLEAVEVLAARGFQPARTIHLAFGHDEERGGTEGAAAIAGLLAARGVRLEYVLDEGLVVGDGLIAGVRPPVALIGVAEKGRVLLELTVRGRHGHASMPPAASVIGTLARALDRVERSPMPTRLDGSMRKLFDCVRPAMPIAQRVALGNLWLFEPLVSRQLAQSPVTNAGIRTTIALTVVAAGEKDNVLPGEGRALADIRIVPGDSVADALAHVRRVVNDPAVEIRTLPVPAEPSPVAPVDARGFVEVAGAARRVFPEALVAPGLLVAGTDSKHYLPLADAVYRFRPIRLTRTDLARFHGVNERIGIEAYGRLVAFYGHLLRAGG